MARDLSKLEVDVEADHEGRNVFVQFLIPDFAESTVAVAEVLEVVFQRDAPGNIDIVPSILEAKGVGGHLAETIVGRGMGTGPGGRDISCREEGGEEVGVTLLVDPKVRLQVRDFIESELVSEVEGMGVDSPVIDHEPIGGIEDVALKEIPLVFEEETLLQPGIRSIFKNDPGEPGGGVLHQGTAIGTHHGNEFIRVVEVSVRGARRVVKLKEGTGVYDLGKANEGINDCFVFIASRAWLNSVLILHEAEAGWHAPLRLNGVTEKSQAAGVGPVFVVRLVVDESIGGEGSVVIFF